MDVEVLGIMIPIIGIILGVTIAIVSIVTSHRQKVQRADQRPKDRLAAIEKGLDLPFDAAEPENGKKGGSLRSGLIGLFVGIVLYFGMWRRQRNKGRIKMTIQKPGRGRMRRRPSPLRLQYPTISNSTGFSTSITATSGR